MQIIALVFSFSGWLDFTRHCIGQSCKSILSGEINQGQLKTGTFAFCLSSSFVFMWSILPQTFSEEKPLISINICRWQFRHCVGIDGDIKGIEKTFLKLLGKLSKVLHMKVSEKYRKQLTIQISVIEEH